jgi:hypothetical protein
MRKLLFISCLSVIISGLILTGCHKDDTDGNYFQVGSNRYTMSWGFYNSYGTQTWAEGYVYSLYLLSPGMSTATEGTGDFIYFYITSPSDNGLGSGTYAYDGTQPWARSTFNFAYWCVGYNSLTETGNDVVSGNITVVNSGSDSYEISFDGKDSNGVAVKAHFKGTIKKGEK